jgi:hypothetical protein
MLSVTDQLWNFIVLTFKLGSYALTIIFIIYLLKKYAEYKEKYDEEDQD